MAVIDCTRTELEQLLGTSVSVERLEEEGSMLGILFEPQDDTVSVEVEPNRPDLLSVEGVARALKGFFDIDPGFVEYPIEEGSIAVQVDESVEDVRPYIACARVKQLDLDQAALDSIIQLQEKLTTTYGRKREKIAIGLHDFAPVEPPITYQAVAPNEIAFTPLGMDEELSLAAILEQHDKGNEYGWILDSADQYPIIVDSEGVVLSFPPIINGVVTEVTTGTDDLFIDVTGTSRDEVVTALNIIVAALYERGGVIEAVTVDGEAMPDLSGQELELDPAYVRQVSGLDDLSVNAIIERLEVMNYRAEKDDEGVRVTVPGYRADIMHPYDLVEDVVIGYGYDNVEPVIPDIATIGGLSEEQVFLNQLRELMVGVGAQELMTFMLSNTENLFEKMERDEEPVVAMANPLTEDYTLVRNWLLPSLLDVLAANQHNRYPQQLFEVGRCSEHGDTPTGSRDTNRLAYVSAHDDASFAEVRGVLQALAVQLGVELSIEPVQDPSFTKKRCGTVLFDGTAAGIVGEVSEQVRANWDIEAAVAGFELDVSVLRQLTT